MKLKILSVGNRSPQWVRDGVAEYSKRMPRELKVELVEIGPGKHHKDPAKFKADEGLKMMSAISESAWVVSLDERGEQVSSTQLADRMNKWQALGRDVVFAIGGSDGLDASVLSRADESIALSALTLPHYLVRVVLTETLYRAWTINQGHPYHRA
ncbi:MAG: 23S rRNA (pseudouridine(1915)-N(3))-methyltransferase RlmH [Pseudomonadales bacterium]